VIDDALAAIPEDASSDTAGDIRRFAARTPAVGPGFRCSADFVRLRARQMLVRLREKLRQEAPPPLEPAVCYTAPFALDASPAPPADGILHIYGFDLDLISPQLILISTGGAYVDVTSALVPASHYHLTVRIGGVPISSDSRSLGLAWGHLIRYSVTVLRPSARLCSSRIESIPAGKAVSYRVPPAADANAGRSLNGTSADVALHYFSNKVEATICVTAANAAISGCTIEFLYTTDPDRVIDGVLGRLTSAAASDRRQRPATPRKGADPVRHWIFSSRPAGPPGSADAFVTARLGRIRVVSSEDDGCIAPVVYAEARRTSTLDPRTRAALDPQLRTLDREIVALRPRFAPVAP
jgi:hypothetical protein